MSDAAPAGPPATRVVLRPLATPLPLGFLALALATTVFSAVQLGWIPADQGRIAGLTALAATVPLQLLASVFGFLCRDPVAATGMGVLAGTWAWPA
jgi:succinate-acetate transporter protein